MKKKTNSKKQFNLTILSSATVLAIVFGIGGYLLGSHKGSDDTSTATSKAGYVASADASLHVQDFYDQYTKSGISTDFQSKLLAAYGSKNLAFYNNYYQHGFNPLVCSSSMPTKVTVSGATSGPESIVSTTARFSDGSSTDIKLTVVENNDGMKIDSISCSGNKANLPPQSL